MRHYICVLAYVHHVIITTQCLHASLHLSPRICTSRHHQNAMFTCVIAFCALAYVHHVIIKTQCSHALLHFALSHMYITSSSKRNVHMRYCILRSRICTSCNHQNAMFTCVIAFCALAFVHHVIIKTQCSHALLHLRSRIFTSRNHQHFLFLSSYIIPPLNS